MKHLPPTKDTSQIDHLPVAICLSQQNNKEPRQQPIFTKTQGRTLRAKRVMIRVKRIRKS
jgi:hypothetical protein